MLINVNSNGNHHLRVFIKLLLTVRLMKGKFGIGVVIRDGHGQFMGAMSKPFFQKRNTLAAKLMVVKKALVFCVQAGFASGELMTDSSEVVRLSYDNNIYIGVECHLLEEVKILFHSLGIFCLLL